MCYFELIKDMKKINRSKLVYTKKCVNGSVSDAVLQEYKSRRTNRAWCYLAGQNFLKFIEPQLIFCTQNSIVDYQIQRLPGR
jgi:hypothetical protein